MSDSKSPSGAPESPRIGPPATHRLLENDDVVVWLMDVGPDEIQDHHYHHYDYVLYYTTDVLATTHGATTEHTTLWNARYDHSAAVGAAQMRPGILTRARSLYCIPGTGFLSPGFHNIGDTRMIAPLIEVKRPRRADQAPMGYARTDALVDVPPRSGCVHLLENDRLRVFELTLEPGESDEARAWSDCAVEVIEGSVLEIEECAPSAAKGTPSRTLEGETLRRTRDERAARSARWLPAVAHRRHRNVGATRYRALAVELK